jgi:hypothetical protein
MGVKLWRDNAGRRAEPRGWGAQAGDVREVMREGVMRRMWPQLATDASRALRITYRALRNFCRALNTWGARRERRARKTRQSIRNGCAAARPLPWHANGT